LAYRIEQQASNKSGEETTKEKKPNVRSKNKKAEKKQSPFPFLSLPAEIRNEIYEYTLTDFVGGFSVYTRTHGNRYEVLRGGPLITHLRSTSDWRVDNREIAPLGMSVLSINRSIHDEATSYLYSRHFYFEDGKALYLFLRCIGGKNRALLRHVTLMNWTYNGTRVGFMHPAFDLLAEATGLQSLGLQRLPSQVTIFYRQTYYWLKAVSPVWTISDILHVHPISKLKTILPAEMERMKTNSQRSETRFWAQLGDLMQGM